MKAIIPAAGYGTRLETELKNKPKAFIEINNIKLIDIIIDKIKKLNIINEIIIITNNKYHQFFEVWLKGKKDELDIPITLINDGTNSNKERLGVIKDVYLGLNNCDEDFLIINSDNYFSFELKNMLDFFLIKKSPVIALYDVGTLEEARKMGSVELGHDKKIIFFKEKDLFISNSICSIGIYMYPASVKNIIKKLIDDKIDLEHSGNLVQALYKEIDVFGHIFNNQENFWYDVGTPEIYNKVIGKTK